MTTIQAVIEENRALVARMRELNTRAGEDRFAIPTREQLATGIAQILGGIARLADIRWPETLRLPTLDAEAEAEVLRLCPDTIAVCGQAIAVEYRAPYYGTPRSPLVRVDFRGEQAKDWLKLPDCGVKLPDGRELVIVAPVEGCGWSEVEAPSAQFKGKVLERLTQGQWDAWKSSAPAIALPEVEDYDSVVPFEVVVYGHCPVTGAELQAYGTVVPKSYRYYDTDPYFEGRWYRNHLEAHNQADASAVRLCELYDELMAKRQEEEERAEREALKKRVGELYDASRSIEGFARELSDRLYNTRYGYSGGATTVDEFTALIAEAEAAVATYEAKQAEAERLQREAEERRAAVEVAIDELLDGNYADGHVWVPEGGEVAYVLAGKTSKMGDFVVTPRVDAEVPNARPYCFGDYKYQRWVPFSYGVKTKAQDFSRSGNIQSEVALYLRKGVLEPGVYGVASDGEGQFFYPVIHHAADGAEVVPEVSAVKKYRSPKQDASAVAKGTGKAASQDALAALAARFAK
jgi:hypothetical protein